MEPRILAFFVSPAGTSILFSFHDQNVPLLDTLAGREGEGRGEGEWDPRGLLTLMLFTTRLISLVVHYVSPFRPDPPTSLHINFPLRHSV